MVTKQLIKAFLRTASHISKQMVERLIIRFLEYDNRKDVIDAIIELILEEC